MAAKAHVMQNRAELYRIVSVRLNYTYMYIVQYVHICSSAFCMNKT